MAEELRINHALHELSRIDNGREAVEILCIITYFAPENIDRKILSSIEHDEKEIEISIELLKQFSLVHSGEDKTVINIYKTVQKVMLNIIEKQNNKFVVLTKALRLLFMQGINSLNLDHAVFVWNHLTSFPQEIQRFTGLASCIIEEFITQTRYKEGDLFGRKALDFVIKVLGKNNTGTWGLQHSQGLLLAMAGRHEESLKLLLPLYENNREHSGLRETLLTIARQLGELSRFDEALRIFQHNIFHNKKVSDANDDLTLSMWHDYAHLLRDMKKYHQASEILKQILKRRKQISNTENDDTLTLTSNLGHVLLKESKYSEALKTFHKVLDRRKAAFGKDHVSTLKARRDIALVFQHQGKHAEALVIYEELTEEFKNTLGHGHPETWAIQANLATLFEEKGEYQKALEIYTCIYKKQTEILGEKDPDSLGVKYHIVTILFILERHDEALQTLQEVHKAYIEVFGLNHPKTVDLRTTLETLNSVNLETIFSAAWEGNLNKVKSMIQSGIDINNTDYHKKTPLHYAAEHGHSSVVKLLLKNGAIYNAESEGGETPFQITEYNGIKNLLTLVAKLIKDARDGIYEKVSKHIAAEKGIVNAKDNDGSNALHWAAHNGHKNIVKLLLENGANATQVTNKGNTPLHIATSKDFKDIIRILLQHASFTELNDFINAQTTAGRTASLHIAAENGCVDLVKLFLKHGAIYDIKNREDKIPLDLSEDLNVINLLKLTKELFQGAKNGNLEIISKLHHIEPDEFIAAANARDIEGNTLLQAAIHNKYKNVTGKFLELFKEPDKINSWSRPKNRLEKFEMLREIAELHIKISQLYILELRCMSEPCDSERISLPSITLKDGSYYLRNAHTVVEICKWCANNSIDNEYIQAINDMLIALEFHPEHIMSRADGVCDEEVEFFVSKGQGKQYYKLLHSGLKKDVRLFIKLVERNIEGNVKKFVDSISLKWQDLLPVKLFEAIENNNHSEVEARLKDGIDVNSKNADGRTPLHYAVNNGSLEIINILLKNGADYTQVTTKGDTLLHIATSKDLKEIVYFLLQQVSPDKLNGFINAQSVGGTTSLHVAARNGSWNIVKSLLKYGAIYNIQNEEGETPLDLSTDENITRLLKLISELFQDAKNGYPRILDKLQHKEGDELKALTNACNNEGCTLLQVASTNKHKNTVGKFSEMIKKQDGNRSCSVPKLKLDQIEKLKEAAESCIKCSESYLPMLRNTSQSNRSEKNSFPWATLKAGSYYLRNVHGLVQVYKECMHGSIDDANIQAVDNILVELEFDPKHITLGYTDEAFDGKVECFVSKGQGTKYYELLHSKLKKDVRSFVEIIQPDVDVYVKRFLKSIKHELLTFLSGILFDAIKNNNSFEVKNCLTEESVINVISTDGKAPLHCAVNIGNVGIINTLLKHGADISRVDYEGATPLHAAAFKGHKRIVDVLLQHVSQNKLNHCINAQCRRGFTALHIAANNGSLEVVDSLLKHGAINDIKNLEGKTALDLSHDQNIANLLKQIQTPFGDATNGNFKIIRKLKRQSNKFTAIKSTRNF